MKKVVVLTAALAAGAIAGLAAVLRFMPTDMREWSLGWAIGITTSLIISELVVFHYRFRGSRYTISLLDVVLCVALVRLDAGQVVVLVALATIIARLARRQSFLKLVFNGAQFTLAAEAAVAIRAWIAGDVPLDLHSVNDPAAIVLAVVLGFGVVNFAATALVISFVEHQSVISVVRRTALAAGLHLVCNVALGLVIAVVTQESVPALVLVAGLVALYPIAFRSYMQQREDRDRAGSLSAAARELVGRLEADDAYREALRLAADLFKTDHARLVIAEEDGSGTRFDMRGGVLLPTERSTSGVAIVVAESVPTVVPDPADPARSWLVVPLRSQESPVGHLALRLHEGTHRADAAVLADAAMYGSFVASVLSNARLLARERDTIRKLRELDALKSDFIATVSHELRTPVTAIKGFLYLLREKGADLAEARQAECVEHIHSQSKRLESLIEDLLTSVQIDSGSVPMKTSSVDLGECARTVSTDLFGGSERVHIDVRTESPSLVTDNDKVRVIFKNLVDNALKYSPEGSPVIVTVEGGEESVSLVVDDCGPGVPLNERARIFERFFQVEHSTTRRYGGVGLGLYISSELARVLGASISCGSAPTGGARFTFTIPKSPAFSEKSPVFSERGAA